MLDQQNRQQFLEHLASQLGRKARTQVVGSYTKVNNHPVTRLTELDEQQRYAAFIESAQAILVDCVTTTQSDLLDTLNQVCQKYGGGEIILNDDIRLQQYGVIDSVKQQYTTHIWSANSAETNRSFAAKANIGIAFAEYGLTESGGVVLYSAESNGRSVSLLPPVSIVLLERSKILPRVAQLATILHQKAQQGERMPSCVNIISGPSATADIELVKVVGVHGPVKKVYLIIEDR